MPKNKKDSSDSESDSEKEMKSKKSKKDHKKKKDTSDSDSGPDDKGPIKKGKPEEKKKKGKAAGSSDELSWNLGKTRFAKLTEFKNTWYLDIREFYNSDGELKPGKKGIMLTMEQWQKLKDHIKDIDEAIKQNV